MGSDAEDGIAERSDRSFSTYQRGPEVRSCFCRRCGYNLRATQSATCPECGTPFDRSDPRTVLQVGEARRGGPRGWRRRLFQFSGGVAVAYGPLWLVVYLGFRSTNQHYLLDLTASCCCLYVFGWPLILGTAIYLIVEAVTPEAWGGVAVNLLIAMATGFLLGIFLPLVLFNDYQVSGLVGVAAVLAAPVAGLVRARRLS